MGDTLLEEKGSVEMERVEEVKSVDYDIILMEFSSSVLTEGRG